MARKGAYVCSLTETHVQRIEAVLDCMVEINYEPERKRAAQDIKIILRCKLARDGIRPKARK